MINRIYLKDFLSFQEVDLELDKGLVVFTGPSGAGKSVLMQSILSLFAITEPKADLGEVTLSNLDIEDEAYDIQAGDEIIIKEIKKDKVRYFLNAQSISKKNLNDFSKSLVKHLHLKDTTDFDSSKLINFLDRLCSKEKVEFKTLKESFDENIKTLFSMQKELNKIKEDESKLEDLKEYAKFEIEKIASVDPQIGEYEELSEVKKRLSKKEKIQEAIEKSNAIFNYSSFVNETLNLLDEDSSFFDEAINELNNIYEKFNDSLYELEDLDIESVLDRIEKLSSLQKRFGSIKEALEYKEQKQKELDSYENISFEKAILEKNIKKLSNEVEEQANKISQYRKEFSTLLEEKINHYLEYLYLSNAKILLVKKELDTSGIDEVVFELNKVNLDTISSGEFNRLRLALLTAISEYDIIGNGILFLDEIDANLSGKESSAIAKVLTKLAKNYQIFAISHQPQLTSAANIHFLVDKKDGISTVKKLDKESRINEIARMISGENITEDAHNFAKNLLE
ncbi:AAA family ATPase [Halarcobacter ebronensis]|uniref:DNA repair protein RecN n=1 Tax=Halarcobacter ebronensis TaxID=1462615 RepID=A0A4Q1AMM3_9BACT|nr:AAA family ATPase [Halarcobacter ebronensis]QKF82932.1 DNA repair protein RecN [Halarcobacter ebronensis]RXK06947.1 DNA recombination protein RecN [Halarcobacter ebronensis]